MRCSINFIYRSTPESNFDLEDTLTSRSLFEASLLKFSDRKLLVFWSNKLFVEPFSNFLEVNNVLLSVRIKLCCEEVIVRRCIRRMMRNEFLSWCSNRILQSCHFPFDVHSNDVRPTYLPNLLIFPIASKRLLIAVKFELG